MINLLYNKKYKILSNNIYVWVLDYLTKQTYIKFNYHYLFINAYNIIIKNNKYLVKYQLLKNILKFLPNIKFLQNFIFTKISLKIIGVGYKINSIKGTKILSIDMGYSYKLYVQLPEGIVHNINKENNCIELMSDNKVLLTTIIYKLKHLHRVDPYKGKGFKLLNEVFVPKFYKK